MEHPITSNDGLEYQRLVLDLWAYRHGPIAEEQQRTAGRSLYLARQAFIVVCAVRTAGQTSYKIHAGDDELITNKHIQIQHIHTTSSVNLNDSISLTDTSYRVRTGKLHPTNPDTLQRS